MGFLSSIGNFLGLGGSQSVNVTQAASQAQDVNVTVNPQIAVTVPIDTAPLAAGYESLSLAINDYAQLWGQQAEATNSLAAASLYVAAVDAKANIDRLEASVNLEIEKKEGTEKFKTAILAAIPLAIIGYIYFKKG